MLSCLSSITHAKLASPNCQVSRLKVQSPLEVDSTLSNLLCDQDSRSGLSWNASEWDRLSKMLSEKLSLTQTLHHPQTRNARKRMETMIVPCSCPLLVFAASLRFLPEIAILVLSCISTRWTLCKSSNHILRSQQLLAV